MTSGLNWVQAGEPVVLDWVHTGPPVFVSEPPPPPPLLVLDSLADVDDAASGAIGDFLAKDTDGQWRPVPPPSGGGGDGGTGYHHDQLVASDVWTITHGLGFHPSGIVAHDSIGDIIEPADIVHVSLNVLRLLFTGRPTSGIADMS